MTNGDGKLLSHGWKPEGHLTARYDKYCQLAAMYLLGMKRHTIHSRRMRGTRGGEIRTPTQVTTTSAFPLLWTYQYPFAWFDFRNRRETQDGKEDWFANCQVATRASQMVLYGYGEGLPASYTPQIWGILSSARRVIKPGAIHDTHSRMAA